MTDEFVPFNPDDLAEPNRVAAEGAEMIDTAIDMLLSTAAKARGAGKSQITRQKNKLLDHAGALQNAGLEEIMQAKAGIDHFMRAAGLTIGGTTPEGDGLTVGPQPDGSGGTNGQSDSGDGSGGNGNNGGGNGQPPSGGGGDSFIEKCCELIPEPLLCKLEAWLDDLLCKANCKGCGKPIGGT